MESIAVRSSSSPDVSPFAGGAAGKAATRKLGVVFVGGFKPVAKDGSIGGSLFAARSLVSSPLAEHVRWVLIDTTARAVPAPPVPVRAFFAAKRVAQLVVAVARPDTDLVLLFAGGGLGFVEKGAMALLARATGKPVMLSPRSGMMPRELARSRALRWYARAVLTRCDRVVCQGDTWRRFYQELTHLPDDRFLSVPNWVDLADYATIRPAQRAPGPPVFLYLGWVEPYKGALDLIRAVHRYRAELGEARVVICGRGSAFAEASRLVDELGLRDVVELRGWVLGEQKRAVLAASDVLVLPSHLEGMPNALLEAMATGLAVVASRVGAIPDTVEEGKSGLLVDPGDIDALGRALVRVANDPAERERMGRAAQERIAQEHDLARAWPRILQAMQDVVGAHLDA